MGQRKRGNRIGGLSLSSKACRIVSVNGIEGTDRFPPAAARFYD